jgi:amino acid transporter
MEESSSPVRLPKENLKRDIGVVGLASAVINGTVGTGIFILPALAAEKTGAAAIICFFICGLLIFLIALCFAEVGSKINISGGTYAYIELAFGPFIGFIANNLFWFGSCVFADAATASALSKTLSFFIPQLDSDFVRPFFFLVLFAGLAYINIRGAKHGIRFIVFATFAKLIPLLLLIAFGTGHITAENLHWKHTPSLSDISSSTFILFFAFFGIETAVTNGGEFKNPARIVPLGIFSGLSFVLILYIAIQLITQGVLGDQLMNFKDAPLAAVSKIIFGHAGITLIVAGTAISMIGVLSGEILANPRILFAGARDGIMPKFLSKVHSRYFTPYWSIIVYSALGFLLAVTGTFRELIIYATAATILIYLGVVLATIRLRWKKTITTEKTFIIPGGIIVPLFATAIIIWLLTSLSKKEVTGVGFFILALAIPYFFIQLFKKKQLEKGSESI